uniref:Metallo-beta-lactamase domain-containing protein n=1 Tax=Acrobeloides nanus TaxID=290746 RepID=A0A914D149_9BILA
MTATSGNMKNNDTVRIEMCSNTPDDETSGKTWFSTTTANFITENQAATMTAINWASERKKKLRPWMEFFNFSEFGLPPLSGIFQRVNKNLDRFFSNYLCIFIVLLVYCIVTEYLLLLIAIALGGMFYTIYKQNKKGPLLIYGYEVPPSLLYSISIIISIPLFYLAEASHVLFLVFGTSLFVIFLHAFLYRNEEIPGAEFEKEPVHVEVNRSYAILPKQIVYLQPLPNEAVHYRTDVVQLVNGTLNLIEQGSSMQSSNTLVQDSGYHLIVDTASATDISAKEQMLRGLSEAKIFPGQIQFVLTTHGHPDHMGQANFFPNARHFFASYEYTGNNYIRTELYTSDAMRLTRNIEYDVSAIVHNVPDKGIVAVVGDLFYSKQDAESNGTEWNKDAWNPLVGYRNRKKVLCEADWIVPGHGEMFEITSGMRQIYKCPPKATTTVATPTAMPYTEQGVLENNILPVATGFRGSGNALHSFSSKMDFSGSESINGNIKSTNGPLYDAISRG